MRRYVFMLSAIITVGGCSTSAPVKRTSSAPMQFPVTIPELSERATVAMRLAESFLRQEANRPDYSGIYTEPSSTNQMAYTVAFHLVGNGKPEYAVVKVDFEQRTCQRLSEEEWNLEKAMASGSYGALDAFLQEYPASPLLEKARQAMAAFSVHTIETREELFWKPTAPDESQPPGLMASIDCLMRNVDFSEWRNVNRDSPRPARGMADLMIKEQIALQMAREARRADLAIAATTLQKRAAADQLPWLLCPAKSDDYFRLETGTIRARLDQTPMVLKAPAEIRGFALITNAATFMKQVEEKATEGFIEYGIVICLQTNNSALGFCGSVMRYRMIEKGLAGNGTVVDRTDIQIMGKALFPQQGWVRLKPGVDVKGGSMEFRKEGLFLLPGTTVAKQNRD